jgi:hypothetical protein
MRNESNVSINYGGGRNEGKTAKSVLYREIWNEAIEAAAHCVDQANRDGP